MKFLEINNRFEWDELVDNSEYGHPLQLWGWGELKKGNGWIPLRIKSVDNEFAASILLKKIPKLKYFIAYISRGPITSPKKTSEYLESLDNYLKLKNIINLRMETNFLASIPIPKNYQKSKNSILTSKTLQIDLKQDVNEIRKKFNSSTKKYVNRALRNVEIIDYQAIENFTNVFYYLYQQSAKRKKFALQKIDYYQHQLEFLAKNLDIKVAFAKETREPIAFLWNVFTKKISFELYGGISDAGVNELAFLKANYGLKYDMIVAAKDQGIDIYDFNGRLNDGVEKFKLGFGPEKVDLQPTIINHFSPISHLTQTAEQIIRKIK